MNILVTGATGFIGRHLTAALSKNYSVRCLVRKSSDTSALKDFNIEIAYGDLLDQNTLRPALDGIDLVYHLAGEVYSRRKNDYYNGNILATENLLNICKNKHVSRIIYLSSAAVYKPITTKTLLTEESECAPITIYGETKLQAERLIRESGLVFTIVRAPVVYGPYQPAAINQFFLNAVRRKKVYVIGRGENFRSLCFAHNLVEGLLLANSTNGKGETFVLSDEEPYTLNQIVKAISNATIEKTKVIYLPGIVGDISWQVYKLMGSVFDMYFVELYGVKTMRMQLGCDISKARKEIAYKPPVTLEAGIKSTVEWIEKKLRGFENGNES